MELGCWANERNSSEVVNETRKVDDENDANDAGAELLRRSIKELSSLCAVHASKPDRKMSDIFAKRPLYE